MGQAYACRSPLRRPVGTELGTLRSYIQSRFDYTDGTDDGASIPQAFIELGGFRVGVADEIFGAWNGYAGDIINDDVINYNSWQSNQVSYTFTGGNGFSAIVAAEQGSVHDDYPDYVIDSYMPHVIAGAKYEQSWGTISGVVGYDSNVDAFAAKARLDVNITDSFKVWGMGAYQSDYDSTREERNFLTPWQGDWAAWAGFAAKVSDKATINGQGAYGRKAPMPSHSTLPTNSFPASRSHRKSTTPSSRITASRTGRSSMMTLSAALSASSATSDHSTQKSGGECLRISLQTASRFRSGLQ